MEFNWYSWVAGILLGFGLGGLLFAFVGHKHWKKAMDGWKRALDSWDSLVMDVEKAQVWSEIEKAHRERVSSQN